MASTRAGQPVASLRVLQELWRWSILSFAKEPRKRQNAGKRMLTLYAASKLRGDRRMEGEGGVQWQGSGREAGWGAEVVLAVQVSGNERHNYHELKISQSKRNFHTVWTHILNTFPFHFCFKFSYFTQSSICSTQLWNLENICHVPQKKKRIQIKQHCRITLRRSLCRRSELLCMVWKQRNGSAVIVSCANYW